MYDSPKYRDTHKNDCLRMIRNDMKTSYNEYKDILKFNINNRKHGEFIDELIEFIKILATKVL